jgi:hypothetical protein
VGDPVHVGHNRNSRERRMMLDQGTEAQLQVPRSGRRARSPCRDAGNSFGHNLAQGVERSSPRIERTTPSRC